MTIMDLLELDGATRPAGLAMTTVTRKAMERVAGVSNGEVRPYSAYPFSRLKRVLELPHVIDDDLPEGEGLHVFWQKQNWEKYLNEREHY